MHHIVGKIMEIHHICHQIQQSFTSAASFFFLLLLAALVKLACSFTPAVELLGHFLLLWSSPPHDEHLILQSFLDILVPASFSPPSFLLTVFGLPGIFFLIGGKGLGFEATGQFSFPSTGCRIWS